ncbi:MAG: helix-turn-helix domain-containing protein [Deltaproteobacteria bacterium]|nr:helix-turn-helix domain-containing protein [Deltaproteobacteria bacterium]
MGVNYSKVFERMLKAGRLKNGSQLAKALGVSPQAVSNYKKRGELPASLIFKFAETYSVSIDWLINGVAEPGDSAELSRPAYASEADDRYFIDSVDKAWLPSSINDLMMLSPDEIIYVGRLLKVLRGPERYIPAVKVCIDSFIKAGELSNH